MKWLTNRVTRSRRSAAPASAARPPSIIHKAFDRNELNALTPEERAVADGGEDTKRNLKHVGYLFSLVKARRKLLT